MLSLRFIFVYSILLLALEGCDRGVYDLKFQPAHNSAYSLVFKVGGDVEISFGGKSLKTPMSTTITSRLHFDTLPNRKFAVTLSFDNYEFGQQVSGKRITLDSLLSDSAVGAANLAAFLHRLQFRAEMNDLGKLERVVPNDSMWHELEYILGDSTNPVKERLAGTLKPIMNADMMFGMVQQCFSVFPPEKVDIGDKWRNQINMRSLYSMVISNEFELRSVKNGLAEIHVVSRIENGDTKPALPSLAMAALPSLGQPDQKKVFDMFGVKMEAAFKGKQEGTMYVETGSGIMQTANFEQHLEGTFKINNIEIPMKLNLKNDYRTSRK